MEISDEELRGRTAIGADGKAVGEVIGLAVDTQSWTIKALRLRLRNEVAQQMGVDHSLFRAGTVDVPVDQVQSVGDAVVLSVPAAQVGAARARKEGAPTS